MMQKIIELRPYQIDIAERGVVILLDFGLLYLAMHVRTGKTLTALQVAENYGAKSVLFLTKLKAVPSIQADYELLRPSYQFHVTNYEKIGKINPDDYDLIIIDEGQNFGAFPKPSARMLAAKKLAAGKPVIMLSGTPSPESYSQLFHQLAISSYSPYAQFERDPRWGFRHSFYRWARAGYVTIKKKKIRNGMEVDDYSQADGNKIWQDIKHLFIMFTQEEAGFEAPVQETILYVKMKPDTYARLRELDIDHIRIDHTPSGREVIATVNSGADLINKLAQVSSGTLIYDLEPVGMINDYSKAEFIKARFFGKRIAIFYKYKAERQLLINVFPNYTEVAEQFNTGIAPVFIGQVQSQREGINLSTADALVMYNIDFSATSYFQVRARIQSKERTAPAELYWIFSEGGIEDKIYRAVSNKKNFTHSYYAGKGFTKTDHQRAAASRIPGVATNRI